MNRKDYCILPICFLLYGLTFFACGGDEEIYAPYPPDRILVHSITPFKDSVIHEDTIITVRFSERPDHFLYQFKYHTSQDLKELCWGRECFEIHTQLPPVKMTATWDENSVHLAFVPDEPITGGSGTLSLEYSRFSEYDNPKYSLRPADKESTASTSYSYYVGIEHPIITSHSIVPSYTKDGNIYVKKNKPFEITVVFDKPAAGVQATNFRWCSPAHFNLIACEKMKTRPIFVTEQQGKIFTMTFPSGISNPQNKSDDRFKFSIVFAGGQKTYDWWELTWWKTNEYKIPAIHLSESNE